MRWRQNKETGKLVPIDEGAARRDAGVSIHGIFEPYVSHVDGSVISDPKSLREHNRRNNVVQQEEFTPEYYEKKAQERADFYEGRHSREEKLARKQELYEVITAAERNN